MKNTKKSPRQQVREMTVAALKAAIVDMTATEYLRDEAMAELSRREEKLEREAALMHDDPDNETLFRRRIEAVVIDFAEGRKLETVAAYEIGEIAAIGHEKGKTFLSVAYEMHRISGIDNPRERKSLENLLDQDALKMYRGIMETPAGTLQAALKALEAKWKAAPTQKREKPAPMEAPKAKVQLSAAALALIERLRKAQ